MTYFKPPRRKIGVATLLLACLVVALWMRSWTTLDVLDLRVSETILTQESLQLLEGCFGLMYEFQSHTPIDDRSERELLSTLRNRIPRWNSYELKFMNPLPEQSRFEASAADWLWKRLRIGAGKYDGTFDSGGIYRQTYWMIPYWSLVIPLTLLSGWLLLSRPRTKPGPTHA